ncbi:MAG: FkbM family methyltransferase [Elainellaceae cyanobacterium]
MINDFLSRLPNIKQDFIYDLLSYQDLKLCLDVGAAAGAITQRIKKAGSDDTRVIGFEPFEGNHAYFEQTTRSLSHVELIKKAAHSETKSNLTFRVLSTVKGSETGWEKRVGYSSTGFLTEGNACEAFQSNRPGTQDFTVDTIAIDDLIDEHVDFMKIDVQGGEYEVLKGCQKTITHHGIDIIYIEFDGDRRILEYLTTLGYTIFDSDYLLILKDDDIAPLQQIGFYDFEVLNLSVGRKAYRSKLQLCDEDYCEFLEAFRQNIGYFIYTDLICVSSSFLSPFLQNLAQYLGSQPVSTANHNSSWTALENNASTKRLTQQIPSQIPKAEYASVTENLSQPNIPESVIPESVEAIAPNPKRKRQNRQRKKSKNPNKTLYKNREARRSRAAQKPSVAQLSPASPDLNQESKSERFAALLQRMTQYYSRWPLGLALLAIASNLAACLDSPFRWEFVVLGTGVLLFLIGHAASKSDRMLSDIEILKEQQIKLDKRIRNKQNRRKINTRPNK